MTERQNRPGTVLIRNCHDYEPWGKIERWADPHKPYPDCSSGCSHAAWLEEPFSADWCVCLNPESHRAGLLTFEHQGCEHFEPEAETKA